MSKINILHLSDLHFGLELSADIKKDIIAKRIKILDKLIEKIENLEHYWQPDIIIISGDIGFSGEKENYEEAWKWIDVLLKRLNLTSERIILCAGNHDRYIRDIHKLKPIYPKIDDVDRFLEKDNIKKLEKRFNAFSEFCRDHNIHYLIFNDNKNHLIGFREIQKLRFVVLNSSWFSLGGKTDRGNVFIGLPHILDMKKKGQLIDPDTTEYITISILHHPFEWLNQSEIDKKGKRGVSYVELAKNCDVILSGHTHGEELFEPDKKFAGAWLFKVGAIFDKDPLVYNCEILKINVINRSADRLKLYYDTKKGWIDEVDLKNPYLFTNGLSRLRIHAKKVFNEIYDKIGKDLKIDRSGIINTIKEELKNNDLFFITGETLVGKSVVLKDLASELDSEGEVLAFNVSSFLHNDIEEYFKNLHSIDNFRAILDSVRSGQNRYIFIDEVERILESEFKLSIFKDLLTIVFSFNKELKNKGELKDKSWKLIICSRSEKYKNVREITDRICSNFEMQINNKKIEPLTVDELKQVSDFYPKLASLINQTHLTKLITLPKILDILTLENFKLTEEDIIEDYPHNYYTETYLMKQFWEQIIRNNEQIDINNIRPEERDQFLQKLSLHYFTSNEPYKISKKDNEVLFSDLVSKRILLRDGEQLNFTHDVFEEWALLRNISQKSDVLNDFLIPFNDFNRYTRAFQLYSRKMLEIDGDSEKWKKTFNLLEQNSSLNPIWKQDLIYGLLKSEILNEILFILRDTLILEENKVLKEIFKLMRIKCVIFEEDLKPDVFIWFPIILYTIDNLFSELSDKSLLLFTEIIEKWLSKIHFFVQEFFNKILDRYIEFAETRIIIEDSYDDLSYSKESNLKKNILSTILWGFSYKSEEIILFLDKVIESKESKQIFEEVLFDKYGYMSLCKFVPEYALKVLKLYLIKTREIPERIDFYHDPLSSNTFFRYFSYEREAPFYNFLNYHEDYGLSLIHEIINHATKIWIHTDQPVFYGPIFYRISEHRTPLPQKIQLSDDVIEVWGDDVVYSWFMHLGMGPRVVRFALTALERWIFEQILDHNRNPSELITKVLRDTNSFSVVAVSIISILHLFIEYTENRVDINCDDLIKAIQPVIEKPAFWSLDLTRSIYYGMGLRDYRSKNIEILFGFIKFNLGDNYLKNELLSKIAQFSKDIFLFFEEEKSYKPLLNDRFVHMRRLVELTKDENWRRVEINEQSALQFILPKELQNDVEKNYYEERFSLLSIMNWIYFSFEAGELKPQYNSESLLKYMEELIKKDERVKIPKAFTDLSADRAEVITGYFALLILYNWEFLKKKKLERKAIDIILRAIKRPQALNYMKSSVSLHPMGYKRSAARAIPILYQRYPKNRQIKKAIVKLIKYNNHEVRNFLFSHLALIWKKNYKMNWKCIQILFIESLKKRIIKKKRYYIINKSIQKERGFSPRVQFENVKKIDLMKLYIKRSLETSLITIKIKNLKELNPEEVDLIFFGSVLYIIPKGSKILEVFPKNQFLSYLEDILLFTIKGDIFNKTSYEENKIKYHNPNLHFYQIWGNKALSVIGNAALYLELDKVKNSFIKPILLLWKNSENVLKVFLEEFIIVSDQPDIEEIFIEIWNIIADHIFKSLMDEEKISYSIINLIFFQDNYGRILKKNIELETSIKRLNVMIRKFLNNTNYYHPILKLVNEFKNPLLSTTAITLLYDRLKSFSFNEEMHIRLRRELYRLIESYWTIFQEEIKNDYVFLKKFQFLIEVLIDWGEPLAGKLQEDLENSL